MSCFVWLLFRLFFFFKQKTAYEMRISDWSSDVCSSDLTASTEARRPRRHDTANRLFNNGYRPFCWCQRNGSLHRICDTHWHSVREGAARTPRPPASLRCSTLPVDGRHFEGHGRNPNCFVMPYIARSEEHTSELQSLMRISYAVFCLKKKKTNII